MKRKNIGTLVCSLVFVAAILCSFIYAKYNTYFNEKTYKCLILNKMQVGHNNSLVLIVKLEDGKVASLYVSPELYTIVELNKTYSITTAIRNIERSGEKDLVNSIIFIILAVLLMLSFILLILNLILEDGFF